MVVAGKHVDNMWIVRPLDLLSALLSRPLYPSLLLRNKHPKHFIILALRSSVHK
jgi:hypothetical protein